MTIQVNPLPFFQNFKISYTSSEPNFAGTLLYGLVFCIKVLYFIERRCSRFGSKRGLITAEIFLASVFYWRRPSIYMQFLAFCHMNMIKAKKTKQEANDIQ